MIKDVNGRFDGYSIYLKLDEFYYSGAMNWLKVICHDLPNELLLV